MAGFSVVFIKRRALSLPLILHFSFSVHIKIYEVACSVLCNIFL